MYCGNQQTWQGIWEFYFKVDARTYSLRSKSAFAARRIKLRWMQDFWRFCLRVVIAKTHMRMKSTLCTVWTYFYLLASLSRCSFHIVVFRIFSSWWSQLWFIVIVSLCLTEWLNCTFTDWIHTDWMQSTSIFLFHFDATRI